MLAMCYAYTTAHNVILYTICILETGALRLFRPASPLFMYIVYITYAQKARQTARIELARKLNLSDTDMCVRQSPATEL